MAITKSFPLAALTDVDDDLAPTTGKVLTWTGLQWGAGDAPGGSTDPEVVRDTMASTLVAGSNVTITPDDAGDTITVAATDMTLAAGSTGDRLRMKQGDARPTWDQAGMLNVRDFGAVGDGLSDDTAAITSAATQAFSDTFAAASAASYSGGAGVSLSFPPGNYLYTGPGLNDPRISIVGAGPNLTRITLGGTSRLVDVNTGLQSLRIEGLQTVGGLGLFRQSLSTGSVLGPIVFRNCWLFDYTECGIGTNSSDAPYWTVEGCVFRGVATSAIGVAHAGDASGGVITRCKFDRNRYHLKLGRGGGGWRISENDFIRVVANPGNPVTDIWIVPYVTFASALPLHVTRNKFGNENLAATDFRLLYADEAAGTDFLTKYHSAVASTGTVRQHLITHNTFNWLAGTEAVPGLYSTTDEIHEGVYGPNVTAQATQFLSLLDGSLFDFSVGSNLWGPYLNYSEGNAIAALSPVGGKSWYGMLADPFGQFQDADSAVRSFPGAGTDPELVLLNRAPLSTYTLAGATTRTNGLTDIAGGSTASELVFTTNSDTASSTFSGQVAGRPMYVEADLKAGASSPIAALIVRIYGTAGQAYFQKVVTVTSTWRRYRWLWFPKNTVSLGMRFLPLTGVFGSVQVANVRLYQAREPVQLGVNVRTVTAGFTVLPSDDTILADATSGAFTLTLPAAAGLDGKSYTIKKTDSTNNIVTIDANASELIDGLLTYQLTGQYTSLAIVASGGAWSVRQAVIGSSPYVHTVRADAGTSSVALTTGTAYVAKVEVSAPITITKLTVVVGAPSGNGDVGIYRNNGTVLTRLVSNGGAAITASSLAQTFTVAATTLYPGYDYAFAWVQDNGTATIGRVAVSGPTSFMAGRVRSFTGSNYPLPTSFTISSAVASGTNVAIVGEP